MTTLTMRRLVVICGTTAFCIALSTFAAEAGLDEGFVKNANGKFHPFNIPGLSLDNVSMSDSRIVAGSYREGDWDHGFVRLADGTIAKFDPSQSLDTRAYAVNASGMAVGSYATDDFDFTVAFERVADGSIQTFAGPCGAPRAPRGKCSSDDTSAEAINAKGWITGYYDGNNGTFYGFIRQPDGTFTGFGVSAALETAGESINAKKWIAGFYYDKSFVAHGFLRSARGKVRQFDAPESTGTFSYGINDTQSIAGFFYDGNGVAHGFLRLPDGTITAFDPPGSVNTYAYGINDSGSIAGYFEDGNGANHGFLRTSDGAITTFDAPGSTDTQAVSLNSKGAIAGTCSCATAR